MTSTQPGDGGARNATSEHPSFTFQVDHNGVHPVIDLTRFHVAYDGREGHIWALDLGTARRAVTEGWHL